LPTELDLLLLAELLAREERESDARFLAFFSASPDWNIAFCFDGTLIPVGVATNAPAVELPELVAVLLVLLLVLLVLLLLLVDWYQHGLGAKVG
jgi:hypothetical protein